MTKTKWDYITNDTRASLMAQPFGRPCSGCDKMLETEGDFAAHFIVPNSRYLNLGYCPENPPANLSFYFS